MTVDQNRNDASSSNDHASPIKLDENECFYSVLEVENTSSAEEIKQAYERLVAQYHPRTKTNLKDIGLANRQMHVINQAYAVLSNAATRRKYDEQRVKGFYGAKAGVKVEDNEIRANTARIEEVIKQNTKKLWDNYLHPSESKGSITDPVLAEDFLPHQQHDRHDPKREGFRSLERRYEQVDQEVDEIYAILMKLRRSADSDADIQVSAAALLFDQKV